MVHWLSLIVAMLVVPAWAAEGIEQEIRRVDSALTRISQDQQSVYQQFQMVQVLLRSEESKLQPLQSYTPPATPPNYDDVKREESARIARVKQYQEELDRLFSRYRELEEQKKGLVRVLTDLAQQNKNRD
jgi:hypothetical protein